MCTSANVVVTKHVSRIGWPCDNMFSSPLTPPFTLRSAVYFTYTSSVNVVKMALPGEIWTQIFEFATDEDVLFQPGIQTSMAESAWYRDSLGFGNPSSKWSLRSPEKAMDILLRRSYTTKKVNVVRLLKF